MYQLERHNLIKQTTRREIPFPLVLYSVIAIKPDLRDIGSTRKTNPYPKFNFAFEFDPIIGIFHVTGTNSKDTNNFSNRKLCH